MIFTDHTEWHDPNKIFKRLWQCVLCMELLLYSQAHKFWNEDKLFFFFFFSFGLCKPPHWNRKGTFKMWARLFSFNSRSLEKVATTVEELNPFLYTHHLFGVAHKYWNERMTSSCMAGCGLFACYPMINQADKRPVGVIFAFLAVHVNPRHKVVKEAITRLKFTINFRYGKNIGSGLYNSWKHS